MLSAAEARGIRLGVNGLKVLVRSEGSIIDFRLAAPAPPVFTVAPVVTCPRHEGVYAGDSDRSAFAGRRSNLRRRSRPPSPSDPTPTRMTIFRSSAPP
jgi:hypothetical protein